MVVIDLNLHAGKSKKLITIFSDVKKLKISSEHIFHT